VGAMAAASIVSARTTARALGLRAFRWFDAGPREPSSKRFLVRAVSSLSGLVVAMLLFFVSHLVAGKGVPTTEIDVLEGRPAATAGLLDGDRIVAVGGVPVSTGDEVRSALSAAGDIKQVEVERRGRRERFDVAPESGRIGVAFVEKREPLPVTEAALRGVLGPFELWASLAGSVSDANSVQVAGPIAIVNASNDRPGAPDGMLRFLAMLASFCWPLLAGVHAYAALTRVLFERTYVDAARVDATGGRVANVFRLHQALVLSLACLALALVAHLSTNYAGLEWRGIVLLLLLPATASVYPLIWSLDQTLAARPSYLRSALLVVPCVAPFAALGLIATSRKHLREAGFTHGFLVPRRR
jgi:hypothetical protein